MIDRAVVEKLNKLGLQHVVDGFELCPSYDGLLPGIEIDCEIIMQCPVCHDQSAVTVGDADRWRDEMCKRYGRAGHRSEDEVD